MARNASHSLTSEQALQRAASLCSTSEHCIADIKDKLYRWGIPQADSEKIIDALLDEKYIDEKRYAIAYTNDKLRFSHWGIAKIKAMLRMQHIPEPYITRAIDGINREEYLDILGQVIESKQRSLGNDDSLATKGKIIRFALQRGFEMHDIEKFVSEY